MSFISGVFKLAVYKRPSYINVAWFFGRLIKLKKNFQMLTALRASG
jgi:hypothetical protein